MSLAVKMKNDVNSISLVPAQAVFSGETASPKPSNWTVTFPNGDTDDTRHATRQEALNSLCEMEDIQERARTELREEAEIADEIQLADYVSTNIADLADECGYKVEEKDA